MPIYSVPIHESSILKSLEDSTSVRIIGCGFCDNWSLAHHRNQPITQIIKEGDQTKTIPYSLSQETSRYKKLLTEKGVETEIEVIPMLCQYSEDPAVLRMFSPALWTSTDFVDRCRGSDAVLCFGCSAAYMGLRKRLGDEVKIVPALKSTGAFQIQSYLDESGTYIMMDKEGSTIIENK